MTAKQIEHNATYSAMFRQLHNTRPLVLPNAWDAASARIIAAAGASAIATTSAGMAWAHGLRDGQVLTLERLLASVRAIVQTVALPVTADIESGYGNGSAQAVASAVTAVLRAGAVGINLEDSPGLAGAPLLSAEAQAERIRAARAAALALQCDVFINARTDVFLAQVGDPATRLDETIRRAHMYCQAGADGIFIPGTVDLAIVAALAKAIAAPINIMAGAGAPSVQALAEVGVARISVGPALMRVALATTQRAVREMLEFGTFSALTPQLGFAVTDALFRANSD
jgi:2-methylisocitrate lyase-like PEP mutase family enzyme